MSLKCLKDSEREVSTLKTVQRVGNQNPKTVEKVNEMMAQDCQMLLKLMGSQL